MKFHNTIARDNLPQSRAMGGVTVFMGWARAQRHGSLRTDQHGGVLL
jgi:molybdopterin synthase catalytic subunit